MHPAASLTEIEKDRARTMMRNNRVFQSVGISAIVSMIRKSNVGKEHSAVTAESPSISGITQGDSSDYIPRDEEVDERVLVEKTIKVYRSRKKSTVKKKSRNWSSLETSMQMVPGRVMAVPPEASKILLELDDVPVRVTWQKKIRFL